MNITKINKDHLIGEHKNIEIDLSNVFKVEFERDWNSLLIYTKNRHGIIVLNYKDIHQMYEDNHRLINDYGKYREYLSIKRQEEYQKRSFDPII